MRCPECDGDGVIYTTEDMPCPECDGTGEDDGRTPEERRRDHEEDSWKMEAER